MALSYLTVRRLPPYMGVRAGVFDVTLDDSYAAGGWAIDPDDLKYNSIIAVIPSKIVGDDTVNCVLSYDQAAGKLQAFDLATGVENADADGLDGTVVRILVIAT